MKKKEEYQWLNLIRGLAAMAVFTGHLRIIFFRDVDVSDLNYLYKATVFVTGFGHLAVVIFFVLSGFLIIKSIDQSTKRGSWNTITYARNRFFRLWVVLIPCLILGLIWDRLGIAFWGDSLFYSNQWKYFLNQDIENKLSATIFIGNALFLQKILVPTLGSNGALWSLTNEFWYYVIFPLLYFGSVDKHRVRSKVLYFTSGIILLFFVGEEISITFPIWLMGGLSYIISVRVGDKILTNKLLLSLVLGFFLLAILLNRVKYNDQFFNFYVVAVLFSLAIPFLIKLKMNSSLMNALSNYMSNISYTLYLAHLPFLYLVTSIIGYQDLAWNLWNFSAFLLITFLTVAYSTLLWYIFEKNTDKIKSWMYMLGKKLVKSY